MDDQVECNQIKREAQRIRLDRFKDVLAKRAEYMAHMQTVKEYRKEIYKAKPKTITQSDFKLVRAKKKVEENEVENLKRSIFMLNKADILKDYKKEAFEEAQRLRNIRLMTREWAGLIAMKRMSRLIYKEIRKRKEKRGLEIYRKYNAIKIQKTFKAKRLRKGNKLE